MQDACDDSTVRRRVTETLHAAKAACEHLNPPSLCNAVSAFIHEMLIEYMCEHYAS